jgi:hypothetical protein
MPSVAKLQQPCPTALNKVEQKSTRDTSISPWKTDRRPSVARIAVLYRETTTSRRNATHRIYPYLLRGLAIKRSNQVLAMDTT